MDSRTLKRLFPFIAGGACTKDQAAALALCATGDEGRVAGGMVVVEAEAASRMLTVIGLALQGRADVLEAKQRLAEVEEQVAWMDARLEELQKQARELEQRFDKELFALEREAVSLMKPTEEWMMFDWLDPFKIRTALSRPGQIKVVDSKTIRVFPDASEAIESGRQNPWKTCLRAEAEHALEKARTQTKIVTSPPAVLVSAGGEIELSEHKVLSLGDKIITFARALSFGGNKTITFTRMGQIEIPPGASRVRYKMYSGRGDIPQIDIALTRALFYLAKEGILENIE
jgi:hypothetical protein